MAMSRWALDSTTALACCDGPASILERLRHCSIIHTYLASTALVVAWTPDDVSATPATSGYAHTVQGQGLTMGRWVVEASTALPC